MQRRKNAAQQNVPTKRFSSVVLSGNFWLSDFRSRLKLVKLILVAVSAAESAGHSREGCGGVVGSSCEAVVQVSLPALHLDSRREPLIHRFNKTVSSRAWVSTLLFLTSPARCSCDLRALSAPRGGRRSHTVESTAGWVVHVMSAIFVQSLLIFSRCVLSGKAPTPETY